MDFGLVLFICIYYSLLTHRFRSVSAAPNVLEIIQDRRRVEELAVKHAKYKHSWRNTMNKPISKIRKNICDKLPEVKVALCQSFLPMTYMGFKFESSYAKDLTCAVNTFWIRHFSNLETDNFELEMYQCPNIRYRDLETDEDITIGDKYYVSKGTKYNSAIVFLKKNMYDKNDKIYPRKYINNIVFDELVSLRTIHEHQTSQLNDAKKREDGGVEVIRYGEAQIIREPYEKFRLTFHSMNICGRPKAHKVYLCRTSLKMHYGLDSEPLQLQNYDQHRCKKRRMRPPLTEDEYFIKTGEYMPKEMHFHLLQCPLMSQPTNQKVIQTFAYLSSNLHSSSLMLLTRVNDWGKQFIWERIFYDVDTGAMVEDRRRVKKMIYPSKIDRARQMIELQRNDLLDFEKGAKWMYTNVQTPVTISKIGLINWTERIATLPMVKITETEPLVEDIVILYSQIKAMKLAYQRFMKTYWSLDMCELPLKIKTELCNNILKRKPFEYYRDSDENGSSNESFYSIETDLKNSHEIYPPDKRINRACPRREVNLGIREIDSLEAQYFSMWNCPKARSRGDVTPIYYISKCHLKNALLIFKTSEVIKNDEIIFPEAIVTKIDRESLAQIVFFD